MNAALETRKNFASASSSAASSGIACRMPSAPLVYPYEALAKHLRADATKYSAFVSANPGKFPPLARNA